MEAEKTSTEQVAASTEAKELPRRNIYVSYSRHDLEFVEP
jgi:hypothetical protein